MPIYETEEWVQIAELDALNRILFTSQFKGLMGELGWEAKAFVSHLLTLWYDPFEHMLDYSSGDSKVSTDQPGEFDCNGIDKPQEVVEHWAEVWSKNDREHLPAQAAGTGLDLSVEWYRDVLRAKLVSMRLPKRLLIEYKKKILDRNKALDSILE